MPPASLFHSANSLPQ